MERQYHQHAVAEVHHFHRAVGIDRLVEVATAVAVVSSTTEAAAAAVQSSPDADAQGLVVQAAQDFVADEEAAIRLMREEARQVAFHRVHLCPLTAVVAIREETIIRVTLTTRRRRLRPEDTEEAEAVPWTITTVLQWITRLIIWTARPVCIHIMVDRQVITTVVVADHLLTIITTETTTECLCEKIEVVEDEEETEWI